MGSAAIWSICPESASLSNGVTRLLHSRRSVALGGVLPHKQPLLTETLGRLLHYMSTTPLLGGVLDPATASVLREAVWCCMLYSVYSCIAVYAV